MFCKDFRALTMMLTFGGTLYLSRHSGKLQNTSKTNRHHDPQNTSQIPYFSAFVCNTFLKLQSILGDRNVILPDYNTFNKMKKQERETEFSKLLGPITLQMVAFWVVEHNIINSCMAKFWSTTVYCKWKQQLLRNFCVHPTYYVMPKIQRPLCIHNPVKTSVPVTELVRTI